MQLSGGAHIYVSTTNALDTYQADKDAAGAVQRYKQNKRIRATLREN